MDPIGGAASILTLLDAAIKTTKLINHLIHQYRDVPVELCRLKHKVAGLKAQLVLLRALEEALGRDAYELGVLDTAISLEEVIKSSWTALSELCGHLEDHCLADVAGRRGKMKWAVLDASKIKTWELALQEHSAELGNILMLLNLSVHQLFRRPRSY